VFVERLNRRDDLGRRRFTLHRALDEYDLEAVAGVEQLTGEVAVALRTRTGDQSDAQRDR